MSTLGEVGRKERATVWANLRLVPLNGCPLTVRYLLECIFQFSGIF